MRIGQTANPKVYTGGDGYLGTDPTGSAATGG